MWVGVERRAKLGAVALVIAACLAVGAVFVRGSVAATGTWQRLVNAEPFDPGAMVLLTDGTVLVQDQGAGESGTGNWWRLTPDSQGDYLDGTWSKAASLPSGYSPLYYASAVLPDGRFIIEGGEFNAGQFVETNQGAIYDPVANTWKSVAPPAGGAGNWVRIGDAPGVVLANGQFLLGASGYSGTADQALLNASSLTWTTTGGGKAEGNGEEGFTLLPGGKVLTVDAKPGSCSTRNSEIYNPTAGTWTSAGLTPSPLVDCGSGEIGPQLLMYDGNVFVEGSTSASAVYHTSAGTWTAGPTFPTIGGQQYDASDAASALLPDGDVLLNLSPGEDYTPPSHWFVYDGSKLTQVADDLNAAQESSNDVNMLLLPTGQVLVDYRLGSGSIELYTDGGSPQSAWRPHIGSVPATLNAGSSYALSGTQLNGLSQGAAFGDDYDPDTDYPLVQITNTATGTVVYARTSGMSNRSIAPGASSSTTLALPSAIVNGASELRVVTNGIASLPVAVTVTGGTNPPQPVACVVPKLKGKPLAAAKRALSKAHCRVGKVTKKRSSRVKRGRVISQKPPAGKHLAKGAKVALVVSNGAK